MNNKLQTAPATPFPNRRKQKPRLNCVRRRRRSSLLDRIQSVFSAFLCKRSCQEEQWVTCCVLGGLYRKVSSEQMLGHFDVILQQLRME